MATKFASRLKYPQPSKSTENLKASKWPPQPTTPLIPDMILPNLYLTDMFTARGVLLPSFAGQGRPNIKYILSVLDNSISQPKPKSVNMDKFVQKLVILDDTADADLLVKLSETCDWIDSCILNNDGGVLVHCQLGQSRSASVVIAYVMRKENLGFEEALAKVKRKRSVIKPNLGFQRQLQLWAEMAYDIYEVDPDIVTTEGAEVEREAASKAMRKKEAYVKWKEEQRKRVQQILEY